MPTRSSHPSCSRRPRLRLDSRKFLNMTRYSSDGSTPHGLSNWNISSSGPRSGNPVRLSFVRPCQCHTYSNGDRHRAVAKTACRWPTRRRVLPRLNSKSSQRLFRTSRTRNTPSGTTPRLGGVRRSLSPLVVNYSVPSISLVVLWCSYTRPAMRITHFSLHCPEYLVGLQFCGW